MAPILKSIVPYLKLPSEVTTFEAQYLRTMNRVALFFLFGHIPVLMIVAAMCGTHPLHALLLSSLMMVGPTIAYRTFKHPRTISSVLGFTAMCLGGLLVHFGQGSMQIEMHFYFFVLLALLAVFANPFVVIVAAVTIALHHFILYLVLPHSVFNYDASVWTVLVHSLFVVLESVAACFVARHFFDNVIGLDRIVQARTVALDARNRDMRVVFDNVAQGFLTLNMDGTMSAEHSAVVAKWFGNYSPDTRVWDYIGASDPAFADIFESDWETLVEDVLPIELALEQMPKQIIVGTTFFDFDYQPIMVGKQITNVLLVVTDVTADVQRERGEATQREMMQVFERILKDKEGFVEFLQNALEIVRSLPSLGDVDLKRAIHTLKGNCASFGLSTIAALCHELETKMATNGEPLSAADMSALETAWAARSGQISTLIGERTKKIELAESDCTELLAAVDAGAGRTGLARIIKQWSLEPTRARLDRLAEQTRSLARKLGKGDLTVDVDAGSLRLQSERWAPFWAAFVHAVRNAVDHGIESKAERTEAGKPESGRITLRTKTEGNRFTVAISDDGRGIAWGDLERSARAAGLPSSTHAELMEAMFHDGISTREVASELSGRGVGMGALRKACTDLGGEIDVTSELNRGTTVTFSFPTSAMVSERFFGGNSVPPPRSTNRPIALA